MSEPIERPLANPSDADSGVDFSELRRIMESGERHAARRAADKDSIQTYLKDNPNQASTSCGAHGVAMDADLKKSYTATNGEIRIAYEPCSECNREREREEEREREQWRKRLDERKQEEEREAKRRIEAGLAGIGIPNAFMNATIQEMTYKAKGDQANFELCRQFAGNPCGFLILLGGVGCGKTHIASAILRGCFMRGMRGGRFFTLKGLFSKMRERYGDPEAENVIGSCCQAPLLALDEIGIADGKKDEYPALHEIVDHRYSHYLPTILTSNHNYGEIKSMVGERLSDRLAQAMFNGGPLVFKSQSFRGEKNGDYLKACQAKNQKQCGGWL